MASKEEIVVRSSGGVGFGGLLTLLFIALKLTGYITWSWWWVLSPLWITALLFFGFALIVLFFAFVVFMIGLAVEKIGK